MKDWHCVNCSEEFWSNSRLSKMPNTVEPLPDIPAKIAPQSYNCDLISSISGYVDRITRSKSFSNNCQFTGPFKAENLGTLSLDCKLIFKALYAQAEDT